jgi:dTDP-4-amino-4,6-dideoxygalactose transaminase
VESVEQTYNINPQKIASAITSKTRAILAVHLYGQPADMKAINQIARQYGLYLIEDAAQAHGAKYYGDLRVKLRFLKKDNKLRQKLALYYCNHIKNDQITIPFVPEKMEPVWHLFVIRHSERDAMQIKLKAMGVETLIHYPIPPHLSDAYKSLIIPRGSFPVTEKIASEIISLPMGPHRAHFKKGGIFLALMLPKKLCCQ